MKLKFFTTTMIIGLLFASHATASESDAHYLAGKLNRVQGKIDSLKSNFGNSNDGGTRVTPPDHGRHDQGVPNRGHCHPLNPRCLDESLSNELASNYLNRASGKMGKASQRMIDASQEFGWEF